jgi:AcrR family transcriptional regulator
VRAVKPSPAPAAGTTRERIADAALALFNARGVRDVTTNHIAEQLGISPGNLYYHFRNKEEIVRALFPRIEAAVHAAIALPTDGEITAEQLGAYYLARVENLTAYRFFFADVNYVVSRDAELARDFRGLHAWLVAAFVELFRRLQRDGHMDAALDDGDLGRIAVNAFIIWWSWLGYVRAATPAVRLDRAASAAGALQSFLVLAPYLEAGYRERARAVLERGAAPPVVARRRGAR